MWPDLSACQRTSRRTGSDVSTRFDGRTLRGLTRPWSRLRPVWRSRGLLDRETEVDGTERTKGSSNEKWYTEAEDPLHLPDGGARNACCLISMPGELPRSLQVFSFVSLICTIVGIRETFDGLCVVEQVSKSATQLVRKQTAECKGD